MKLAPFICFSIYAHVVDIPKLCETYSYCAICIWASTTLSASVAVAVAVDVSLSVCIWYILRYLSVYVYVRHIAGPGM